MDCRVKPGNDSKSKKEHIRERQRQSPNRTPDVRDPSRMARWKAIIIPPTQIPTTFRRRTSRCLCATTSRAVKKALTKDALAQRPADMWRYREMLPVRKVSDIVSLGEVMTHADPAAEAWQKLGGAEIIVKGRGPSSDRVVQGPVGPSWMAVSMGKALGIKHMAIAPPTAMPARALAAYATSCGIKTTIFCPPIRRK